MASSDTSKHTQTGAKTTTYEWTAMDKRGKNMHGEMSSRNATLVKAELRRLGMSPQKVREKPKPLFGGGGRRIKPRDTAIFSRQIATMMHSGVPMVQSFDIIEDSQKNPRFKKMVNQIKASVEGGSSLHEALEQHPKQFDSLYRNLVEAGEQAGVLDDILDTVATYKERTEALKSKIRKALSYPALVITAAFAVTMILLLYVVPVFEDLFASAGSQLPALTRFVVAASRFMQHHWLILFSGIFLAILLFIMARRRSTGFRYAVERLSMRLPIIGRILRESAIARFARTLGVTFHAGVPLVEALDTVADATGSQIFGDALKQVRDDVAVGHPLQLSLAQTQLFPTMVVQMTGIGEEAGALDDMLFKVADFYEDSVNNKVDNLSSLLEPFIMILLGIIVGGMVIALYLPIFNLAGAI